jgi:hypothetical protein
MDSPEMPKTDLFAPMSATGYRTLLTRLDLTTSDAARLLNRTWRTSRRYATGDSPVPTDVAALLRLLDQYVALRDLDRFRGRPPGRPPNDGLNSNQKRKHTDVATTTSALATEGPKGRHGRRHS